MADDDKDHLEKLKKEEKYLLKMQEKFQQQLRLLKIEEAAFLKIINSKGKENLKKEKEEDALGLGRSVANAGEASNEENMDD